MPTILGVGHLAKFRQIKGLQNGAKAKRQKNVTHRVSKTATVLTLSGTQLFWKTADNYIRGVFMFLSLSLSAQILQGGLPSLGNALARQLPSLSPPELGQIQRELIEADRDAINPLLAEADRYIADGDMGALRDVWLKMNVVSRGPKENRPIERFHPISLILQRLRKAPTDPISIARKKIGEAKHVVIITGAGVSQESGVPTFRGTDGLWRDHDITQVANRGAFQRDPKFVWEFYQYRRQNLLDKKPNLGHYAIAAFEHWAAAQGKQVTLLTQNVDGLHKAAGSMNPVELHGNIWMTRCASCGRIEEDRTIPFETLPPHCQHCGGILRPHIVWFGESYDPTIKETMYQAVQEADVVIVAGTSGHVATAPSLVSVAKMNGAYVIEVNAEETDTITPHADQTLLGKSGEILPVLLEEEERIRFSNHEGPGKLAAAKEKIRRWIHRQKLKSMAYRFIELQEQSLEKISEFQKKLRVLPKEDITEIVLHIAEFLDFSTGHRAISVLKSLRNISPLLGVRERLRIVLKVEEKLADMERFVRIAIEGVFESMVNDLPPAEVTVVIRQLQNRLEDPRPEAREVAITELSRFPSLEEQLHVETLSKIEERFHDASEKVGGLAIRVAARMMDRVDSENLAAHLEKIEFGLNHSHDSVRAAVVKAIGRNAPRLEDFEKRLEYAQKIEKRLEDESGEVRLTAVLALHEMIPCLNPEDRLPCALAITSALAQDLNKDLFEATYTPIVQGIGQHLSPEDNLQLILKIESILREYPGPSPFFVKALHNIYSSLKPNLKARQEALDVLDDSQSNPAEKEEALAKFAYSYGDTLSFGATRLLILKGLKKIRGEESRVVLFVESEGAGASWAEGLTLGEELSALADHWVQVEAHLKEHLTEGGKLRGIDTSRLVNDGFLPGVIELIKGEEAPLLLWPLRDPSLLTETVWHLLEKSGRPNPFEFKLSLTLGGSVGDDLKSAALAVHALLARPYPFPATIDSPAKIEWFAPVVDGGSGGIMGNITMNNGHALNGDQHPRYDHFFLQFGFPPSFEHFHMEGDDEWRQALRKFIARGEPKILGTDPEEGGIEFEMKVGEEWEHGIYYPRKVDWEKAAGSEAAFRTLLFVEMAKMSAYQELSRVVEAAWALGVLREAKNQDEAVLPFSAGFTLQKLRALKSLATEFETKMEALLNEANVGDILKTPWVNNKDWSKIRADMVRYQQALQNQTGFQNKIQDLAEEITERVREILIAP